MYQNITKNATKAVINNPFYSSSLTLFILILMVLIIYFQQSSVSCRSYVVSIPFQNTLVWSPKSNIIYTPQANLAWLKTKQAGAELCQSQVKLGLVLLNYKLVIKWGLSRVVVSLNKFSLLIDMLTYYKILSMAFWDNFKLFSLFFQGGGWGAGGTQNIPLYFIIFIWNKLSCLTWTSHAAVLILSRLGCAGYVLAELHRPCGGCSGVII